MNRPSLFDRVRESLAEVARQIEAYESTGRTAEPRRRETVRPTTPRPDRVGTPSREELAWAPPRPAEERRGERPVERPIERRPPVAAALMTRSGLRQAILMQEILGPPKGLRGGHLGSRDGR